MCTIIDFHTHCFKEELAEKAVQMLAEKARIPYCHNGTIQALSEQETACGVSSFVVLPVATKPSQVEHINSWANQVNGTYGAYCFGSLHPLDLDFKRHIKEIKEYGLKGVKLHPEYQDFNVDDPKVFGLYEEIFANDLNLVFHAGEDLGFAPPFHSSPQRFSRVIEAFPKAPIILAHMGGFKMWHDVERFLVSKDVYLDTSFSATFLDRDILKRIIKNHGSHRILFASDSPWGLPSDTLECIRNLNLEENELENILYKNAQKLLNGANNEKI